jgi:glycosyltransferase involved in cell wall biosynthesis
MSQPEKEKKTLLFYGSSEGQGLGNGTGYGNVSSNLIPLLAANYNVVHVATDEEEVVAQHRVFTIPAAVNRRSGGDAYGRDILLKAIHTYKPDILFCMQDIYVFEGMGGQWDAITSKMPSVVYFPTDTPPYKRWVQTLTNVTIPVVYSEYGYNEVVKKMPKLSDKIAIMPHGVDPTKFTPLEKTDPKVIQLKKLYGIPADKKVITFIGRNQRRKNLGQLLVIFRDLKKEYKDAVLMLHTARDEAKFGHGWNLVNACETLELEVGKDVFFPLSDFPMGAGTYDLQTINVLYGMSDVIVSTTLGEGWGLCNTEAFATKRPLIVPSNSVHKELCQNGKYGLDIPIRDDQIIYSDNDVLRQSADPVLFKNAVIDVLSNPDKYASMVDAAYHRALSEFNWSTLLPRWLALLNRAQKEFKPQEVFYETI